MSDKTHHALQIHPAVFVIFGTSIGFLGKVSFLATLNVIYSQIKGVRDVNVLLKEGKGMVKCG